MVERTAVRPNTFEAFDIRLKKWAILNSAQVNDGRPEGRHAVDVRIDQHLIIEPQD